MEYRTKIEQIENGWMVEVEADFRGSIDIKPSFYKKEIDAINAVCQWLKDGTTPRGDQ